MVKKQKVRNKFEIWSVNAGNGLILLFPSFITDFILVKWKIIVFSILWFSLSFAGEKLLALFLATLFRGGGWVFLKWVVGVHVFIEMTRNVLEQVFEKIYYKRKNNWAFEPIIYSVK